MSYSGTSAQQGKVAFNRFTVQYVCDINRVMQADGEWIQAYGTLIFSMQAVVMLNNDSKGHWEAKATVKSWEMVDEAQNDASLHKAWDEQVKPIMTFWEGSTGPKREQPVLSNSGILENGNFICNHAQVETTHTVG